MNIAALLFIDSLANSILSRFCSCLSTSAAALSAISADVVINTDDAILSCSAWDNISAAIKAGFAFSSAITQTSLGPAIISISTVPYTYFFALATNALPGPVILFTFFMLSVP